MEHKQLVSLLALRLAEGIGDTLFRRLMAEFETAEEIFSAPARALCEVEGIAEKTARGVLASRDACMHEAEKHLAAIEKTGAHILTCLDAGYPRLLKEIHDYPAFLFIKSAVPPAEIACLKEERCFAVVGTRRATAYGKKVARDISHALALRGVCIVSGLASGIDTAAHRAALEAEGGTTLAILGNGIDTIYPPENAALAAEISKRGAVISEFLPGAPPEASNFPKRNRIIVGLSHGVAVVEAPARSGALITAGFAHEYGRSVYAVPGAVTSPASEGSNTLLQKGAFLVQRWEDIAGDLPVLGLAPSRDGSAKAVKVEFESPEEAAIFSHLSHSDPVHIDSLAMKTGFSISTLLTHLLALEIRDLIEQVPGKLFLRKV